ncbi:MAG: tol-pal system protein YbgF [Gammaproteobacteria bacterium]|nr:tol-pal system protein YbgF [Gammaproteobacteria bacterium]MDP2139306.1 tol-pal system protein YbgF [Gammaproteobacteria bacterium]MDP2346863.1 tol-pal system protein YbgF [Gammaproteobacteria bacterium]
MKHTLAALVIAVPVFLLSTSVMSAAGVVEAQPYVPGQTPAGAQPGNVSSNDALVMLLDQFREMRSELETLRGLVEEQGYELRNLQRQSLDRYADLDSRLSVLSQIAPSGAGSLSPATAIVAPAQQASTTASLSAAPVNANAVPMPINPTPVVSANTLAPVPVLQPTVLTEQQQYQVALDSLLQDEQYQRSVVEFDQYLSLYPNGRFVTNAYYWKGQAYLNLAMLNEAREAFEVIVTQYPDGRKVDDAMYSLGTVYDKLGNAERSRQLLRQVQSRFPNTSAANLADIYLRSMN